MAFNWSQPKWWWVVPTILTLAGICVTQYNKHRDYKREEQQRWAQWQREEKLLAERLQRESELRLKEEQRLAEAERRGQELEREKEERERPRLKIVSVEDLPRRDGFTHFKVHNQSRTRNAIIYSMTFTVTDPGHLLAIEKVYPKRQVRVELPVLEHDLRFCRGEWIGNYFRFQAVPNFTVAPDELVDVATCILDDRLPVMNLIGTLEVSVQDGVSEGLMNAMFRTRRR